MNRKELIAKGDKQKAGVAIFISHKVEFKTKPTTGDKVIT